jgi:hypothetical protein
MAVRYPSNIERFMPPFGRHRLWKLLQLVQFAV